jgi:hypothetical protein
MLVLLNKNRGLVDIRWVLLRMLFECLQLFRIVFNTYFTAWSINKEQWAFKAIHWVLIRWATRVLAPLSVPAACPCACQHLANMDDKVRGKSLKCAVLAGNDGAHLEHH